MITYTSATREVSEEAFRAAKAGDLEAVRRLADYSFHMEACDESGRSLLHYAVMGGSLELVRFLTEVCGLSPQWADQELVTPFDLACREGRAEIEAYFEQVCGFSQEDCYRNPILRGMYPDPSIVRVGEDYYMVNSSFLYFPGIPVSHSRDLVHWEVIGYVMTDAAWAEEHMGGLSGGRGFWAPDISYHDGWFTVCATLRLNDDAPCIQQQMVTRSRRPEGPYETPVLHSVRGIDPSIFRDDDGRCYMLLNRGARIMELSADGRRCLSEPKMIWYGWDKHGPEGPHILKKDGWYYCFLAEGGTGKGHKITVARSRRLMGPYEDCPFNPIMTQRDEAGAIQCCGHGKPVSTPEGAWYMVYLCSRFLEGKWGMLGRETCLDEITWTAEGWPVVNGGRGPSYMAKLPAVGSRSGADCSLAAESRGEADCSPSSAPRRGPNRLPAASPAISPSLPCHGWLSPRSMDGELAQVLSERELQIRGQGLDLKDRECRSLLLKRQPAFTFACEFEMWSAEGDGFSDAGIALYYDENSYIKFGLSGERVFAAEFVDDAYVRRMEGSLSDFGAASGGGPLTLGVKTEGLRRSFYINNRPFGVFENVTSLCSEGLKKGKRFTGAMTGVYNNGKNLVCWRQHGNL